MSRKLHNRSLDAANQPPHFLVCGEPEGPLRLLIERLAPDVVTHLDWLPSKDQIPVVCNSVAPLFGFNDGIGLRRVLDDAGAPVTGATLDFWQAAANGLYWQQDPVQDKHNLRCTMTTGVDGRYAFTTVRPGPYTVPYDGPVGDLLRAGGRHAWRPAHFHFIVAAAGHLPLTTELFCAGDEYLEQDAVFGVRTGLVLELKKTGSAEDARGLERNLEPPFYRVEFDFRLKRDA